MPRRIKSFKDSLVEPFLAKYRLPRSIAELHVGPLIAAGYYVTLYKERLLQDPDSDSCWETQTNTSKDTRAHAHHAACVIHAYYWSGCGFCRHVVKRLNLILGGRKSGATMAAPAAALPTPLYSCASLVHVHVVHWFVRFTGSCGSLVREVHWFVRFTGWFTSWVRFMDPLTLFMCWFLPFMRWFMEVNSSCTASGYFRNNPNYTPTYL